MFCKNKAKWYIEYYGFIYIYIYLAEMVVSITPFREIVNVSITIYSSILPFRGTLLSAIEKREQTVDRCRG